MCPRHPQPTPKMKADRTHAQGKSHLMRTTELYSMIDLVEVRLRGSERDRDIECVLHYSGFRHAPFQRSRRRNKWYSSYVYAYVSLRTGTQWNDGEISEATFTQARTRRFMYICTTDTFMYPPKIMKISACNKYIQIGDAHHSAVLQM